MTRENFIKKCFELAKEKNFSEYEIFLMSNEGTSIKVYEGEISDFSTSSTEAISFRAKIGTKISAAYCETLDEENAEFLVSKVYDNIKELEINDEMFIYSKKDKYVELDLCGDIETVSLDKKIEFCRELEREINSSNKLLNPTQVTYGESSSKSRIVNSHGLDISEKVVFAMAYATGTVSDGKENYSHYVGVSSSKFNKIKNEKIKEKLISELEEMKNSESIKSGIYKIILSQEASLQLLSVFSYFLNAEAVQKNLSLFKDKIGEKVASEIVTIVDNPHLEDKHSSSSFDGEGLATYKKNFIENGKLLGFMHNLKTAKKAGVKSTANASRSSGSNIGVSASNLYIKPRDLSREELMQKVSDGLFITKFDGLHAGADAITGEFSLGAKGFKIENKKLSSPVKRIVVSGNYAELLQNIEYIGSDLDFKNSSFGSPSIVVKSLNIAGEK